MGSDDTLQFTHDGEKNHHQKPNTNGEQTMKFDSPLKAGNFNARAANDWIRCSSRCISDHWANHSWCLLIRYNNNKYYHLSFLSEN